ncbi:MAG TPA: biliverdin-producing heme oxygenase [Pseudolysinimonas sp.]|nr:biliverdin-producing heme oxygenase [Pseudolysinimonas sp.]
MAVLPFSQALRERTWSSHGDSEGAGFMSDLMSGAGTRDDYVSLVAQHYFVYEALEAAGNAFAGDAVADPFRSDRLTRLPALESDLQFLLGDGWATHIHPLPTTARYVTRIRDITAEAWAGGFVAHHYTRYLGDLSGGQAIRGLMQKQFGFDTNGVGFYLFDQIADPAKFKQSYREQLDAAGWDDAERERVIDEVLYAYQLNTDLFDDLADAKAAAVA